MNALIQEASEAALLRKDLKKVTKCLRRKYNVYGWLFLVKLDKAKFRKMLTLQRNRETLGDDYPKPMTKACSTAAAWAASTSREEGKGSVTTDNAHVFLVSDLVPTGTEKKRGK